MFLLFKYCLNTTNSLCNSFFFLNFKFPFFLLVLSFLSFQTIEAQSKIETFLEPSDTLNKTRQKLREAESKINTSVLSGLTSSSIAIGTSSNLYGSTMINNQCRKCGRILITTSMVSDGLCADCSNNSGIF